TFMPSSDITGVQLQAYWNNATNNPATGSTGDSTTLADALTDSDRNASTITFEFASNGAWGAGTASGTVSDSPTDRMLNGLVGSAGAGAAIPSTFTFHLVPAGTHSILVYAVSPQLQFQTASYAIT